MYIYGSYRKIKSGVPLFGPLGSNYGIHSSVTVTCSSDSHEHLTDHDTMQSTILNFTCIE